MISQESVCWDMKFLQKHSKFFIDYNRIFWGKLDDSNIKAIYIRLADVMCSLLVVIYPCIHLVEVWHNNKIDSCREMNQKNHTTFHS